jgi:hypothetical protein
MHPALDLPVSLRTEVLNEWLDTRSLLELDSASCSVASRRIFLEVVRGREFFFRKALSPEQLSSGVVQWLLARNIKLRRFCIDGASAFNHTAVLSLLNANAVNLEILSIEECKALTAIPILSKTNVSFRRLKALIIRDCACSDEQWICTMFSLCWSTLTRLELTNCDVYLSHAIARFPSLHMLHLYECDADLGVLCRLIASSPNLRSFYCNDLQGCNDCLYALATHCPLLQVLSYDKCSPDSADGLEAVLRCCSCIEVMDQFPCVEWANDLHVKTVMQHCKALKAFSAPWHSAQLSHAAILSIATRLKDLHHLCLHDCDFTSDEPVLTIAQHCSNLRTLQLLAPDARISEMALISLVCNLKSIEDLRIDHTELDDAVLQAIAGSCPHLQSLCLFRSSAFSAAGAYSATGIAALALGCTALKTLYISGAEHVLCPLGKLLWQALRPGIHFGKWGEQGEDGLWIALSDIERENFVMW